MIHSAAQEKDLDARVSYTVCILPGISIAQLSLFASIYGIGPSTARRLYNLNLRTLDDLEVYYGVEREDVEHQSQIVEIEEKPRRPGWMRGQHEGDDSFGDNWIRIALGLREDLAKK